MMIKGRVILNKKTKDLVKEIKVNEIAVIDHRDVDQIAASSLVEKQVKAIINISPSISGRYPNVGPEILLLAGIPVIDISDGDLFSTLNNGDEILFKKGLLYKSGQIIARGEELSREQVKNKNNQARTNLEKELNKFLDNTLSYIDKEKNEFFNIKTPELGIDFNGKHVLIVVRGVDYKDDLSAIKSYIREMNPIIIAVDGGADACLERGYLPDIIIGDMDSVTDYSLKKAKVILVHAYSDGEAPGLKRVKKLGLDYELFPAPGTSEDIAMLLAYEKGAELITAVGTHTNMIDFLEKGRPGMASTFLVRLKVGDKLVDAKGVSKLYHSKIYYHYWLQVFLAILLPLSIVVFFSPHIKQLLQLLALRLRIIFHL
ncbi:MAG: hypothetical protein FH762_12735 [Firmicutes bacterium]|nr:hypothetical protein [Bacillota bacterium]